MISMTLAIYCLNFERRLCWMLSSLLQQESSGVKLTVDVGYVRGEGAPTSKAVLDFFESQGLRVVHTAYDKADIETYQKRGLVRNRQLAQCTTDWIWFGDCDMTVCPEFLMKFEEIVKKLSPEDAKKMLTCRRWSTNKPPDATNAIVAEHTYPCTVPSAYMRTYALPKHKKSNRGAGYCQIANVANIRKNHQGVYINPNRNPDYGWNKFWKTKSDSHFRRMLGILRVPLPPFVHLQHLRDNEVKKHIELQR